MGLKFTNNAVSTLNTAIDTVATTLTLVGGDGAKYYGDGTGAFTSGEYQILIITDGTLTEELKCTGRLADVLTVVRNYAGLGAYSWPVGSKILGAVSSKVLSDAISECKTYSDTNLTAHNTATTSVHGVTGTVVGTTDTQTLANKTLTNPILNSPTMTTPTLGVASATSVNKVNIVSPSTTATLALADNSSFNTSGAFNFTFTLTGNSALTVPTAGTLATLSGSENFTNKSYNKVAIVAPANTATLSLADNSSLNTVGEFPITITATGTSAVTMPTAGTLATVSGDIGAATGTSLNTTGVIKAGGQLGYRTGLGTGVSVTQTTSKATAVTINTPTGEIVMHNASLGATTKVQFTMTNSTIGANDTIVIHRKSGGTADRYRVWIDSVAAGSAVVTLENYSGGALAEAVVLQFSTIAGSVN